jgi:hypothetical protein
MPNAIDKTPTYRLRFVTLQQAGDAHWQGKTVRRCLEK